MPDTFRESLDDDGVCTLTLARPERLNALTFAVYRELAERFAALRHQDAVHAVVLTGSGRAFCSGGDVHEIIGALFQRSPEEVLAFTRLTGELIASMRRLEKPVIAAVNGVAAGAGAVIALAADLRIFSEAASIAFLFTHVGLTGADMGAGYLLPRVVGLGRASELLLLGSTLDARTAERYGLANQVVPPGECLPTARQLAQRLARGPLAALATTKRCLEREWTLELDAAIELEAQEQALLLRAPDHRAFYDAFLAKRRPVFSGELRREQARRSPTG